MLAYAAAAARAQHRRFDLTGVDRADIDPPRYLRNPDPDLRRAKFIGNVAAEALPFADRSYDVVVSQYGLEYADIERALDEVTRVLADRGNLVWLAHAEGSEIVRQHRRQAGELDYLLADGGPVVAMQRFVAALAPGGDPRVARAALDRDLAPAAEYCRANPPAHIVREILDGFAALVARAEGSSALATALAGAERRLRDHRDRIRSLLDAVLTGERLTRVKARLGTPPWTDLKTTEVSVGASGSPIGLHIVSRKSV